MANRTTVGRLASAIFLSALFYPTVPVANERVLLTGKGMQAYVPANRRCSDKADIRIESVRESAFQGNRLALQKFAQAARSIIGFECENTTEIAIFGTVSGKKVFHGMMRAHDQWVLSGTRVNDTSNVQPNSASQAPRGIGNLQSRLGDRTLPKNARLVIATNNSVYFFLKGRMFAIHDLGVEDPIIETKAISADRKKFTYSDAHLDFIRDKVVTWLNDNKLSRLRELFIAHYLKDHKINYLSGMVDFFPDETPVLVTRYVNKIRLEWEERPDERMRKFNESRGKPYVPPKVRVEKYSWIAGFDINSVSSLGNLTLADARKDKKKSTKQFAEYQRRTAERTKKESKKYISRVKREAAGAAANGYVYRSMLFWGHTGDADYLQRIFLGKSDRINNGSHYYRMYFNSYVVAYSRSCREFLPKRVPIYRFIRRSQRFDGFGHTVYDASHEYDRIYVIPRFHEKYDEYLNASSNSRSSSIHFFNALKNPGKFMNTGNRIIRQMHDMEIFLKMAGCKSPTSFQMEENLLRIAYGRSTIQKAKVRIRNFEKDSMTVQSLFNPKTLGHACMLDASFRPALANWCACLEREFSSKLSSAQLSKYIADYPSFDREIYAGAKRKNWDFVHTSNRCRKK